MSIIKTPTGLVNTLDDDPQDVNVKALADAAALGTLAKAPAAAPAAPAPKVRHPKGGPKKPMNAAAPKAKPAPKVKAAAPVKPKAPTGGTREGAGRKPLDGKEAMHTVSFKCSEAQHKVFRDIPEGGAAWIRRGLDQYAAYLKTGNVA